MAAMAMVRGSAPPGLPIHLGRFTSIPEELDRPSRPVDDQRDQEEAETDEEHLPAEPVQADGAHRRVGVQVGHDEQDAADDREQRGGGVGEDHEVQCAPLLEFRHAGSSTPVAPVVAVGRPLAGRGGVVLP